jgi:hypothetical protein
LSPALDGISVVCVLLGSLAGSREDLAAVHGSRLEMLLARIIDTPVRGFAYEVAGSVERNVLRNGARIVGSACAMSRIPYALLEAEPREHDAWLAGAALAVDSLLAGRSVYGGDGASVADLGPVLR